MKSNLHEKVMESLKSVIPITLIVAALCFTVAPISNDIFVMFVVGAICLILGMGIFTLGADIAMTPIGEQVGAHLTKSRRLWLIIAVSFLMGFIITVSEPDLKVLADQVQSIDSIFLIVAVGVGVRGYLSATVAASPGVIAFGVDGGETAERGSERLVDEGFRHFAAALGLAVVDAVGCRYVLAGRESQCHGGGGEESRNLFHIM